MHLNGKISILEGQTQVVTTKTFSNLLLQRVHVYITSFHVKHQRFDSKEQNISLSSRWLQNHSFLETHKTHVVSERYVSNVLNLITQNKASNPLASVMFNP